MGEYTRVGVPGYRESAEENYCSDCGGVAGRLRRLDFAIIDVSLYLDAYPDCEEAAEMLVRLRAERAEVAEEYVRKCGSLTMRDNGKPPRFLPWEYGGCGR